MIKKYRSFLVIIFIALLLAGYTVIALFLPAPKIQASHMEIPIPSITAQQITWPQYGESAIGAQNFGVLSTNGEQKSVPIASIAKTILVLAILKEKPLKVGEQGPIITITD